MIDALIQGRLFGAPQSRTSKNGNPFATAKLRTPMANGESSFVNVICFSETAMTAMLALQEGDGAAFAGELKVAVYTDKNGEARPSLDLTAHAVFTPYHVQRKRKAVEADV